MHLASVLPRSMATRGEHDFSDSTWAEAHMTYLRSEIQWPAIGLGLFDGWQWIVKCEMKIKPRLLFHIFHDTSLDTPYGNIIEIQQTYVFFFVIYWNTRRGAQKDTKF